MQPGMAHTKHKRSPANAGHAAALRQTAPCKMLASPQLQGHKDTKAGKMLVMQD